MVREMTVEDHLQTARQFLARSRREFAEGDELQGSEKIWGAASHAVMALAMQRGWPISKHSDLKRAVNDLYQETGDQTMKPNFSVAEKFHANYYHGFMDDFQIVGDRPMVEDLVTQMLAMAG